MEADGKQRKLGEEMKKAQVLTPPPPVSSGRLPLAGARAIDALLLLASRRDRVVSKPELLDEVWRGFVVEEANIQVQISTLRKLVGPGVIETIPARGYRFVADAQESPPTARSQERNGERLGNIPSLRGELFGRGHDVAAVTALLEAHPLVTLAGRRGRAMALGDPRRQDPALRTR